MHKRILLVEDEAIIAMKEAKTIENHGFDVKLAYSGEKAIEQVKSNPEISLVLMDIDLGKGMSGTEAAQHILTYKELPIIFLTSHSEKEMVNKVKGITSYGYVLKNSGEFVLIESIDMAFELFEAKQKAQNHLKERENAYQKLEAHEDRLQHINRVLLSLRNINRIITKETDPSELLDKACRLLIETSGYHKAWIILTEDQKPVEPFYHDGFAKTFHPMTERLKKGEIPHCAKHVLATGEVHIYDEPTPNCLNCPFNEERLEDGCGMEGRSSMIAPLQYEGRYLGWIGVVLPTFYGERRDEQELFKEVANDLAYALNGITIRKREIQKTEEIRKREESLRITLQSIGDAVISTDVQGIIVEMNPVAERLSGWSKTKAEGQHLEEILRMVKADTYEKVANPVNRVLQSEGTVGLGNHTILISKNGTEYHIADSAAPIRNKAGQIDGVVLVFRDVTEQYEKDRQLKERIKELDCLYNIAEIVEEPDISLDGILQKTAEIIPHSWLYPEVTVCRITLDDKEFRSSQFKTTKWKQSSTLKVHGRKAGAIEIFLIEEKPDIYEGPFLHEERKLIDAIAERLGRIIERLQSRKELQESELRWQFALDNAGDGVWDWNAETDEVYFSPKWKQILGYQEHEIENTFDEWKNRIHPDDFEQCFRDLEEHFNGSTPHYENIHRLQCKSGEYKWILDRGKVVDWTPEGTPRRVIGTHLDISETKALEAQLTQRERYLNTILQTTIDGFWVVDAHQKITEVNNAYCNMTGYTREELLNMNISDLEVIENPEEITQRIQRIIENGSEIFETKHRKKDGSIVNVQVSVTHVHIDGDKFICFSRNISSQIEDKQKLEKALSEKDFLLKELNHRVKNNLFMISSLISLKGSMLGDSGGLSDIKGQIDAIRIIHEKLFQTEDITQVYVKDYFPDLINSIFSSFSSQYVHIETDIENVAMQTKSVVVLGLIINEIATNAIKYGFREDEESTFKISLKNEAGNTNFVLTISNTGNPFPDNITLENAPTLGLQLIVSLVDQLEGTIELQKEPYPVFTITFPVEG